MHVNFVVKLRHEIYLFPDLPIFEAGAYGYMIFVGTIYHSLAIFEDQALIIIIIFKLLVLSQKF